MRRLSPIALALAVGLPAGAGAQSLLPLDRAYLETALCLGGAADALVGQGLSPERAVIRTVSLCQPETEALVDLLMQDGGVQMLQAQAGLDDAAARAALQDELLLEFRLITLRGLQEAGE